MDNKPRLLDPVAIKFDPNTTRFALSKSIANDRFWPILLKKSLCAFRRRKWAAYVEIRIIAGTKLLQISHSSVSIEHFSGFRQVGRDGTAFFNRIGRLATV